MSNRLKEIKNAVAAMDGDLTAQLFGYEMNEKAIIDDFKWLISQVEKYENATNLAIAQLEESDSIPFALDALHQAKK